MYLLKGSKNTAKIKAWNYEGEYFGSITCNYYLIIWIAQYYQILSNINSLLSNWSRLAYWEKRVQLPKKMTSSLHDIKVKWHWVCETIKCLSKVRNTGNGDGQFYPKHATDIGNKAEKFWLDVTLSNVLSEVMDISKSFETAQSIVHEVGIFA